MRQASGDLVAEERRHTAAVEGNPAGAVAGVGSPGYLEAGIPAVLPGNLAGDIDPVEAVGPIDGIRG